MMKIIVIGGSGLIGSKLVEELGARGHQAVAASPNSGVDTITGEGLAEVLTGAEVVVDVSNSPSFDEHAVLEFFRTSTGNLLRYEGPANVQHHLALSVVGAERLPESGYMRAKLVQEELIEKSSIPYSIVRATQFFEFVARIADDATAGATVRLPPVLFQPIAAYDVVQELARVALGPPLNDKTEIGGPEQFRFDEFIRAGLAARNDPREVIRDPSARYFGASVSERALIPQAGARLGGMRFADWLGRSGSSVAAVKSVRAAEVPATTGDRSGRS